jgi:flagellar motor switch protein FliG
MDRKNIVLTLYGTGETINDFTVTLFNAESYNDSKVENYCANINDIELKDNNWIYATIVEENQKIKFEKPIIHTDIDILCILDNIAIQKMLREVDLMDLRKALKSVKKETLKAILRNMSKRAAKMLLEDMEYMGPVLKKDVNEAQRKIVSIIKRMEFTGEISLKKFIQDEMV